MFNVFSSNELVPIRSAKIEDRISGESLKYKNYERARRYIPAGVRSEGSSGRIVQPVDKRIQTD